jgi:hypothetical protein
MSYQPFPIEVLPGCVANYIREGAAALDADTAFIAVPLLPVLASAIGNARRIRLKSSWTEPAVLWAATVGESGTVKSPSLDLAIVPVWRRQRRLLKDHAKARAEFDEELQEWKDTPKQGRGDRPQPPSPCEHILCADITVEALAARLEVSARGTLVSLEELAAWFGSFNQYKSGGADVAHWLCMHGARALKVDRKTGDKTTIYVPHAAVSVTGTIQPMTLRRVLTPEFFDNGLAARLLVAMPPTRAKKWTVNEISDQTASAMDRLFDGLYALRPSQSIDGDNEPVMVDLHDEALAAWVEFVDEHGKQVEKMSGHERAAWVKLEAYAARFALIFHVVRQVTGETESDYVDADDIANGVKLARWFGQETMRVYGAMAETEEDRERGELLAWISSRDGRVTARELQRGPRRYRDSNDQAELDLQKLVDDGYGSWDIVKGERGGRAAQVFCMADHPDFPRGDGGDGDTTPENSRKTIVPSPSPVVTEENMSDADLPPEAYGEGVQTDCGDGVFVPVDGGGRP